MSRWDNNPPRSAIQSLDLAWMAIDWMLIWFRFGSIADTESGEFSFGINNTKLPSTKPLIANSNTGGENSLFPSRITSASIATKPAIFGRKLRF
ncbi:unnamed protein product [Linum trigynum]|uniref:Uncharacterized protein n=1 Tax=Linum trigynum TaxID=586398 RepID=A0AAV2GM76_9ROSI